MFLSSIFSISTLLLLSTSTISFPINQKLQRIDTFLDASIGSEIDGISDLKHYLHRFGYLPPQPPNVSNEFDPQFESALKHYQHKLGLQVTAKLDLTTLSQILAPRCGARDVTAAADNKPHVHVHMNRHKHYLHFPGNPRWARDPPATLTYAFSKKNMIEYVKTDDMKVVFKRAFARWASVVPINFVEVHDYVFSDIRIGFYGGDHGDGEAFDGALGILAHAFSPESGRLHLDAAERWSTDFDREGSREAIDLESVATHEIGHLLGLGHSSVREAVMYPSLRPRERKVDLKVDDVEGVQALYGTNPKFRFGNLLESETSASDGCGLRVGWSEWFLLLLTLILNFF